MELAMYRKLLAFLYPRIQHLSPGRICYINPAARILCSRPTPVAVFGQVWIDTR